MSMMKPAGTSLFLTVLALALPSTSQARLGVAVVDEFTVNAQYRREVKKGIQGIGTGKVAYIPVGDDGFQVRIKGDVRRPDSDQSYSFKISQTFRMAGSRIVTVAETKEFNDATREHETSILQMVPFIFLARFLPPPGMSEEPVRSFRFRDDVFVLRYRRTEKQVEVELYKADVNWGKFFLAPDWKAGNERYEKFRIPFPKESIVVSFVVKGSYPYRADRDPESRVQVPSKAARAP